MKKLVTSLAALFAAATAWSQCLTLNCPGNLTNDCTGPQGTVVRYTVTPNSTCGGPIAVNCTPPSGSLFPPGTTTVNCIAQDTEQHLALCSFTVTVRDRIAPLISHPLQVQAACTGPAGARVHYQVTATDECSTNVTLQCVPPSGSFFPVGTTIVTCNAVDGSGNHSVAVFPVTVSGGCANCIEILCPTTPIVLNTGFDSTAKTNFVVTATNSCGRVPVEVTCDPPPNTELPVGTNIVKCSATDGAGSFRECVFAIIVRDTTLPYLVVKPLVELECKGRSPQGVAGAQVWYPPILAADNADPKPTVTFVPANGSNFPLGTNSVTCTVTDRSGNQTVKTFLVVVKPGSKCDTTSDDDTLALTPDNWGFELGNLTAWIETGNAFSDQPLLGDRITVKRMGALSEQMSNSIGGDYWRDVTFQIGFKGKFWVGSGDSPPDVFSSDTGGPANESRTGTLLSKQFTVTQRHITFLIGGSEDYNHLRVEFLVETNQAGADTVHLGSHDYRVVFVKTGHGSEELRRENLSVQSWLGSNARIRIVDSSTTGHLNVDDFRFQDSAPIATSVLVAGKSIPSVTYVEQRFYDWDAPIWGFADMHTHPMSHLGFAGKMMHGKPDGPIYEALADCNPDHGGPGPDNPQGDYYRQLLSEVMDDKGYSPHREGYVPDAWKQFRGWPVFTTITHQQMWYQWMRRTYDGGERVIVALCVNAPLLARVSKGPLPYDDLTVGTNQIKAMKAFVARHSDFMEIAYDPFQLREIVRGNRLAVILGSELDDIGNLCQDPLVRTSADAFSKQRVTKEIERLYDLGVRYMFPVHLEDNKFGGTAIGNDMLNLGNKFLNGEPFDAEPSPQSEGLAFKLAHLDYTDEAIGAGVAVAAFGPALPALAAPIIEGFTGPSAPGSGFALGFGVLPVALFGAVNEVLLNAIGVEPLPPSIWPLGNNFPDYGDPSWGHRNRRGLTPLGVHAIREMMKRGMMLDIDHMSHHTITNVLARAEAVPGGYPLNSGHNSFRTTQIHPCENSRTPEQLIRIRDLGGIMGVGYENGDSWSRHNALDDPSPVVSEVKNNCAGTSKSFAQNYLYALERLGGRQIALGTDINGLVPGPGPRFGPQSAFGLEFQPEDRRVDQIGDQRNGVLYEPKYGRPLTTPAFIGLGMDPDKTEEKPRADKGYRYNKEQAAYFAALRIFFWNRHVSEDDLNKIVDAMHDKYPEKGRTKELTRGLVKANVGENSGSDTEKIAGAVYRKQVLDIPCPDEIVHDQNKYSRYGRLSRVWHDYQNNFGHNTPMKRCNTSFKEWDYNFEGVAHYGLLPDFLQDLSNVNMFAVDLSPLFQSAEDVAQMWTKCLSGAYNINHPTLYAVPDSINHGTLTVKWYGEDDDVVEETTNLSSGNWQPSSAQVQTVNGYKVAVFQVNPNTPQKFFRVRKP